MSFVFVAWQFAFRKEGGRVVGEDKGEHLFLQFLEAALLAVLLRAHLNIIIDKGSIIVKGRRSGLLGRHRFANVLLRLLHLLCLGRLRLLGINSLL